MTAASADSQYGYRAWDRRPGDQVDPSVMLTPFGLIEEVKYTSGPPIDPPRYGGTEGVPRAGITGDDRFWVAGGKQPGILDVLGVGPAVLMQDTPTRQESGMQPTGTNW